MTDRYEFLDWPDDIKGLSVVDGRFIVATADDSDHPPDQPVSDLLERVREAFGMDIVFISQFLEGERVIRHVVSGEDDQEEFQAGDRDPLEETFCQRIVDERVPPMSGQAPPPDPAGFRDARRQIGAYVTVPISAPTGAVFGTLCCMSRGPRPQLGGRSELQALRTVAQLLSSVLARPG